MKLPSTGPRTSPVVTPPVVLVIPRVVLAVPRAVPHASSPVSLNVRAKVLVNLSAVGNAVVDVKNVGMIGNVDERRSGGLSPVKRTPAVDAQVAALHSNPNTQHFILIQRN